MTNIKDTQTNITKQHGVENKGLTNVFNTLPQTPSKTLVGSAQKIGTAVYLVTELFSNDKLSNHIRQKSLLLIESLFENLIQEGDNMSLKTAQYGMYEMISYIDIAYHAGFISEMNYSVLIDNAEELQKNILNEQNNVSSNVSKDKDDPIHLAEFFFEKTENEKFSKDENLKDIKHKTERVENAPKLEQSNNETQTEFVMNSVENVPYSNIKKTSSKQSKSHKRHQDIIMIMKQKKNASINDICALIKNCSSKTIQRDLNELIQKGIVVKRGDRRWSVYNLR